MLLELRDLWGIMLGEHNEDKFCMIVSNHCTSLVFLGVLYCLFVTHSVSDDLTAFSYASAVALLLNVLLLLQGRGDGDSEKNENNMDGDTANTLNKQPTLLCGQTISWLSSLGLSTFLLCLRLLVGHPLKIRERIIGCNYAYI